MEKKGRPAKPKTPQKKDTDDEKKLYCIRCGCANQQNFYNTKDKGRQFFGKIPYCKDCVKEIYEFYMKKYHEKNMALYYTCRKIDLPYIHSAYLGAVENINNPNAKIKGDSALFQAYMKNLSFSERNGWGNTFDESMGEDQIDGLASFDVYTKVKKSKKVTGSSNAEDTEYDIIEYDTEYLQNKWGIYSNDELAYLESEYLDWVEKLGVTICYYKSRLSSIAPHIE